MLDVLFGEAPDLVFQICDFLSQKKPGVCADVSFGRGSLSSKLASHGWEVLGSDIAGHPAPITASWDDLPHKDSSVDIVLYDPPYVVGGKGESRLQLQARPTKRTWNPQHTSFDYRDPRPHHGAIHEGHRILKSGGLFIAKVMNVRHKGVIIPHDLWIRREMKKAGFHLSAIFVYIRLNTGAFTHSSTPQSAYGFFIVGKKQKRHAKLL